ncbi:hypothetical protein L2E82_47503 [Cichorium intybus]|uniref:Uncharacterized protein n=1 Tax=Cichorium intybus TaxID=13427 RepID=A0ACB8YW69_CICIN|nr:hypothetical protein L2E82_47503 [Cichorium intybus]
MTNTFNCILILTFHLIIIITIIILTIKLQFDFLLEHTIAYKFGLFSFFLPKYPISFLHRRCPFPTSEQSLFLLRTAQPNRSRLRVPKWTHKG